VKGQFQSVDFIDGMINKLFGAIGMGDSGIEQQMASIQEGGG